MGNQLDSYISKFGLMPQVIKHLTTGKSFFSEDDIVNAVLKDYVEQTAKGGIQTKRVVDYLNELITNTPPQNFDKRVRDIVQKFKEIENTLFANWDSNDTWVINEDTTRQNFEIFLKKDIKTTIYGVYVTNCLWLFSEFFVEFKKLCIEWSIDIDKIIDEIGFILIDPTAANTKEVIPIQLQVSLTQEQRQNIIDEPRIYKFNKLNQNYMHDYLFEVRASFDFAKKGDFGAVCLALLEKKIFNPSVKFNSLIGKLAKYWDIEPPKDKRPNKYKTKKNEFIGRYEILERKII